MSERKAFYRKIAYAVAIAVLLFPLYVLSSPSTVNSQGGKLAKLRDDNNLSQANLGEIDPASETMKLATLGLRGLAVNLLWNKAHEYKKKEDWTNLMAVLDQLTNLQPNFIKFWEFQAWNVSYNVSVEFDDYHDRYYYVREGMEFLQEGIKYNEISQQIPTLLWDMGWFVGQKIGRADEHVQYRRLFREDDDYHGDRPLAQRDNWLRAEEWYDLAIRKVKEEFKDIGRKSQIVFYQSPASARINYAEALQEEGKHGAQAGQAWKRAHERFMEFGEREIEHSTGVLLRLNDYEKVGAEAEQYMDELEQLVPGLMDTMTAERKAELTSIQKEALATPETQRTRDQHQVAQDANEMIRVTPRQLAERIAEQRPDLAEEARELALRVEQAVREARYTRNYRQTANYDYWKTRTELEQETDALEGRRKTYLAKQAYQDGDLQTAQSLYKEGLAHWRKVLDRYPSMLESSIMGEELFEKTKEYRQVLDQLGESLPDDFPLWDIVEEYGQGEFSQELAAREAAGAAGGSPADAEAGESGESGGGPADDASTVPSGAPEQDGADQQDRAE